MRRQIAALVAVLSIAACGSLCVPGCSWQPPAAESGQSDATSPAGGVSTAWDESSAPGYYRENGHARLSGVAPRKGTVSYSSLDALGRTGRAEAVITVSMVENARGRRLPFGEDSDPSGWPARNPEVTIETPGGGSYHGRLWNRSHLVANSLGGDAERHNLVTGTRMQNVGGNDGDGGMAHCETIARKWFYRIMDGGPAYRKAHAGDTLRYAATPVYEGDELVPRAVVVDMRSSDGKIDSETIVYNAAKGYRIDYADGSSERKG